MIKVNRTDQSKSAGSSKKTGRSSSTGGTSFGSLLTGEVGRANSPAAPSQVDSASGVSSVDAILAAQSVDDSTSDESRKKRMVARGETILDRLEELRDGLLAGFIPKERLMELARFVRERRDQVNDPQLTEILDEIELRAEVELAKLSRRD